MVENRSRETTPLLKKYPKSEPDKPPFYDVFVCALAYTVATLFVLSPLRNIFGSSGSKHTVATTAVWFHPIRTLGNLIEVLYYTLKLLSLAVVIVLGATASVKLSHYLNWNQEVHTLMLVCWLSGALGVIGVFKVRANKQSFNTASSAAIIFLVSVLLREDDAQYGALPLNKVVNYLGMVGIGATVSSLSSILFYRKTSLNFLIKKSQELSILYADMLELVVANFGEQVDIAFTEANSKSNDLLTQLRQHEKYASYEIALKSRLPCGRKQQKAFYDAKAHLISLEKQCLHLGGMLHCASVVHLLRGQGECLPLHCLRRPMRIFASEIASFVKSGKKNESNISEIQDLLVNYTHVRDQVLRSCDDHQLDNSLHAACILFAHLLQDIAMEIIDEDESCNVRDKQPSPTKQFEQLTDALHPTRKATHQGIGPMLWKTLRLLRNLDVRHGIRVALGAMVLSLPAYIPSSRPVFHYWHGEWAVITFMIIMARNLGAMTKNIPLRIVGTTIGASVGIAANLLCGKNAWLLLPVGFVVSIGCYYRILSKTNPVFGRFILLSYNLVCLYSFSLSMDNPDDSFRDNLDPIYDIAFHRVVSVVAGILWAVLITLTIWPHSARQALRATLCIQWMRIGMVWKSDPLGIIQIDDEFKFRGIAAEHALQTMMLDLDALLKSSPNEFRLRGKFDPAPYKKLLDSTQTILDAFHSISIMIQDEPVATPRERDLVEYTQNERRKLCRLLFLQFYTASTSVRLGFPVPEYLPEPDQALVELADKITERRHEVGAPKPTGSLSEDNYDFVLFYSYMTVVLTVHAELKRIHEALREIFGSLDDDILFAYV